MNKLSKKEQNELAISKLISSELSKDKLDYKNLNFKISEDINSLIYDGNFLYKYRVAKPTKNGFKIHFKQEKLDFQRYPEYKKYPLFSSKVKILIPKILSVLNDKENKSSLYEIDNDISTAKEMCLFFLNQLVNYYYIYDDDDRYSFKYLKADYLRKLLPKKNNLYKQIKNALINLNILETNEMYKKNVQSIGYRINPDFLKKGLIVYEVKSKYIQNRINKLDEERLKNNNVIVNNLINFYQELEFPSRKEVIAKGTEMCKNKINIKGKRFTCLNKHSKKYYDEPKNKMFLEDSLKKYDYLILKLKKLKIPQPGKEESGYRVYDSLNLLPKWIRGMIKYKGEFLIELDFQCLHPNIAQSLYNGSGRYITHENISIETEIPLYEVKKAHLSLFNMPVYKMRFNILYDYYKDNYLNMMNNIIYEKSSNTTVDEKDRHKITSQKLFKKEVEIMTDIIERLNQKNIYVMYVFDALYVHPNDKKEVLKIMNDTIIKHGVFTQVKG